MVALEGSDCAQLRDLGNGNILQIHCGGAGNDMRRNGVVDLAKDLAGDSHLLDLLRRLDHDGHSAFASPLVNAAAKSPFILDSIQ